MKEKEKLGKRLRRAFEVDELLGQRDVLELQGANDLTVRECERILYYGLSEIKLMLTKYVLTVRGEGLYCSSFCGKTVRIEGDISSLEIGAREGKK